MPERTPTREIVVSTADCRFAVPGSRLVACNIVTEVAVAVHIPALEIAALLICGLPHFVDSYCSDRNPWLYADTAIPLLLRRIDAPGVSKSEIRVRAVGGASTIRDGLRGERNVAAVCDTLRDEGVLLESSDLGGDSRRSLWFDPKDGRLIVRTYKQAATSCPSASGLPILHTEPIAAFR